MELRYRRRGCAQGTEIDFQWLQWRVPTNPDDSTDPCYELHETWLSAGPSRDIFLRDLYNYALQANTDYLFNRDYTFDSLNLIVNPTDPDLQQRLTDRQCPDGQTVFLVTHAKCMIAIARPYQEAATRRKDDSPERGLSAPADEIVELMKIRYEPCGVSQSYCCVRSYKICRDTTTNHNVRQLISTPSTQQTCPETFDTSAVYPPIGQDEWVVGVCNEYCLQGEIPPGSRRDHPDSMELSVLPAHEPEAP